MSWDVIRDVKQETSCACGRGHVIKHHVTRMDDWNRYEEEDYGFTIECPDCRKKYDIDSLSYSYYKDRGDYGTVTRWYLVPKGESIKENIPMCLRERPINYDEMVTAFYTKEQLQAVIDDMKKSRYSTRVSLDESRQIIQDFKHRYRTCKLSVVIPYLEKTVAEYDTREWTYEKMTRIKQEYHDVAASEKKRIEDVLSRSYKLSFIG